MNCWNNGLLKTLCVCILLSAGLAEAQNRRQPQAAYVGYVYPAGGQQGTEFSVRIGGQRIDTATGAVVSGEGVQATVKECFQRIGNQEMRLLKEQLKLIKKSGGELDDETLQIKEKLERRISEDERKPANQSCQCNTLGKLLLQLLKGVSKPPAPTAHRVMHVI